MTGNAEPLMLEPLGPRTIAIHHADARVFANALPDNSVDLIYTDPPYYRSFLWTYGWLAEVGARILRPGGWLLAMGGGNWADEILGSMAEHMIYHYTLLVRLSASAGGVLRPHGQKAPVISRVKPIYVFAKGRTTPRTVVYSPFAGDGNDKRYHHWGQEEKSTRYYVDCFSTTGDLVFDPFVGGGTTAVVCQALERRFIGCDIDQQAVATTRARLSNPFYMPVTNGQLRLAFAKEIGGEAE